MFDQVIRRMQIKTRDHFVSTRLVKIKSLVRINIGRHVGELLSFQEQKKAMVWRAIQRSSEAGDAFVL